MNKILTRLKNIYYKFYHTFQNNQKNKIKKNKIYSKYVSQHAINGELIQIDDGTHIDGKSSIGSYTYIGYNCFIRKSKIGRYVSIANNVSIGPGEHDLNLASTSSFFYDNPNEILNQKNCTIKDDAWIGVDSIIKRGVTVGIGAIVGANSFVNRDVPDFAIVAGSPAKLIKYRFDEKIKTKILKTKWWVKDIKEARTLILEINKNLEDVNTNHLHNKNAKELKN